MVSKLRFSILSICPHSLTVKFVESLIINMELNLKLYIV